MKELTKEQIAEYVTNTMMDVCMQNEKELFEQMNDSKDSLGKLLGVCIGKTMQFCSCVLIETLDYVLNDKQGQEKRE